MEYDVKFLKKCVLLARLENKLYRAGGFVDTLDGEVQLSKGAFKACFGCAVTPIERNHGACYPYEFGVLWHGTRFFCISKEAHL